MSHCGYSMIRISSVTKSAVSTPPTPIVTSETPKYKQKQVKTTNLFALPFRDTLSCCRCCSLSTYRASQRWVSCSNNRKFWSTIRRSASSLSASWACWRTIQYHFVKTMQTMMMMMMIPFSSKHGWSWSHPDKRKWVTNALPELALAPMRSKLVWLVPLLAALSSTELW